jgi:hypothetical protein
MQANTLDEFLSKYIEGYLFADLESVRSNIDAAEDNNAAYLMLAGICAGIEFLGYLTGRDYEVHHGIISTGKGFTDYCSEYLAPIDSRYDTFGVIGKKLIRNGIMHNFATKGLIGVTRRGEREKTHLVRYTDEGLIIINPNFLLEDFKESYVNNVSQKLKNDQTVRMRANRNYIAIKNQDASEINRIINSVSTDLDQWPWFYKSAETTAQTTETIEANGDLPVVS